VSDYPITSVPAAAKRGIDAEWDFDIVHCKLFGNLGLAPARPMHLAHPSLERSHLTFNLIRLHPAHFKRPSPPILLNLWALHEFTSVSFSDAMPIRNPFKRGAGGFETTEGIPPDPTENASNGFQKTNVVGAKPIDIKEPPEYKLSGKTAFSAEVLLFWLSLPSNPLTLTLDRNQ